MAERKASRKSKETLGETERLTGDQPAKPERASSPRRPSTRTRKRQEQPAPEQCAIGPPSAEDAPILGPPACVVVAEPNVAPKPAASTKTPSSGTIRPPCSLAEMLAEVDINSPGPVTKTGINVDWRVNAARNRLARSRPFGNISVMEPIAAVGSSQRIPLVGKEFELIPKLNGGAYTIDSMRVDPEESCDISGIRPNDGRAVSIGSMTVEFNGTAVPAYCLSRDGDAPMDAIARASKKTQAMIAWLVANGYRLETNGAEWQEGLGVSNLTNIDMYYATQTAIWMALDQIPEDTEIVSCRDGSGDKAAQIDKAAHGLLAKARDFSNSTWARNEFRDGPRPGLRFEWQGVDRRDFNHPGDCCGLTLPFRVDCRADAQALCVCAKDAGGTHWEQLPYEVYLACGRLLVGPIRVSGGSGNIFIESSLCGCSEPFSGVFADECGAPSPVQFGKDFWISVKVTGRFMCFNVCVYHAPPSVPVNFAKAEGSDQIVAYGALTRAEKYDSCMCICAEVPIEEDMPPAPPEVNPIFYPQAPCPGQPPPLPPQIIDSPPIILAPPLPPAPPTPPTPPPEILIEPPKMPRPPEIINPPPIVVPQQPARPLPPIVTPTPILQIPPSPRQVLPPQPPNPPMIVPGPPQPRPPQTVVHMPLELPGMPLLPPGAPLPIPPRPPMPFPMPPLAPKPEPPVVVVPVPAALAQAPAPPKRPFQPMWHPAVMRNGMPPGIRHAAPPGMMPGRGAGAPPGMRSPEF